MSESDRRAIDDLVIRYATALDTRDWERLRGCFVDDAVAEYGVRRGTVTGVDEIVATCRRALSGLDASQHLLGNLTAEIDGDTARSTAYVHAQHVLDGVSFIVGGTYHDRLVRSADGWRISHRRLEQTWTAGDPDVFTRAEARA